MPDDPSEIRRLPLADSGRITAVESQLHAIAERLRSGRGDPAGNPAAIRELETRVKALEQFISNLQGQNGITVTGPIVMLDRKQGDQAATDKGILLPNVVYLDLTTTPPTPKKRGFYTDGNDSSV